MSWQLTIILQIFASTVMTLFTRRLSLSVKKVFFGVGVLSYITIAAAGWIFASTHGHGLPTVPTGKVWLYLLAEGFFIPAAWLVQYKLIGYIGASNAIIVTAFNTLSTAVMGILFLGDALNPAFILGGSLIIGGILIALRLQPDTQHHVHASLRLKLALTIAGAMLFAVGMFYEKVAINHIGAWHYAAYGWSMQAVGALGLFVLFGQKERVHITPSVIRKGVVLGALTSVAGMLYIYAVSKGSLSHTIVATSGKTAIVMVAAAIFLHERNSILRRLAAFALTVIGLGFILS